MGTLFVFRALKLRAREQRRWGSTRAHAPSYERFFGDFFLLFGAYSDAQRRIQVGIKDVIKPESPTGLVVK